MDVSMKDGKAFNKICILGKGLLNLFADGGLARWMHFQSNDAGSAC